MRGVLDGETQSRWYNIKKLNIQVEEEGEVLTESSRVVLPPRMGCSPFTNVLLTGTELFSGSGRLSQAFEEEGFDMYQLDKKTSPTRKWRKDFGYLNEYEMRTLFSRSYLHASFPCETYSNLSTSFHMRTKENNFLGQSPASHRANGLLLKFYEALSMRFDHGPVWFTIENPLASFHHHPIVKKICDRFQAEVVVLSYCAFGDPVRKDTVFVTNSRTLIRLSSNGRFRCRGTGRGCVFRPKLHRGVTKRFGRKEGLETSEVTAFPFPLTTFLANCILRDISDFNGEYDHCPSTFCEFVDGHNGLCSDDA